MANQTMRWQGIKGKKVPMDGRTVHPTITEVGMTRTDVMASSRPQAEGAAKLSRGSSSARRRLIVLPVLLLMAVVLATPMSAVAATTTTNKEGLSGYKKAEEKSGTSPSKETSTPEKKEAAPTSTSSSTSPSTESTKASTLPFTGLDLRWTIGMGLLLVGAGFSIVTVQRRHRRDGGR
jgi:cytoskeletal protein RodZ